MNMLNSDKIKARIYADLGLDRPHIKGHTNPVRNSWHFYTAGESVDALFYDDEDFRNGMNRILSFMEILTNATHLCTNIFAGPRHI